MGLYVLDFQDIDKTKLISTGGKGANLGELSKIKEIKVPEGFCISTEAFKRIMEEESELKDLLDELSVLNIKDRNKISVLSNKIRKLIEESVIPKEIRDEVIDSLFKHGSKEAYAVRSSATAEDLPNASFAGQQETYLNIIGEEEILKHISKCWASLFTERAIIYRIQNSFDHRKVFLSVVIQKMVFSEVSGVMFTADSITSNREIVDIDASFGLGEALVSGLVTGDSYKVCNGKIIDRRISTKKNAIVPLKSGAVKTVKVDEERQGIQVLTDREILKLEQIGRKIEKHFGYPQDIEWCLVDGVFYIVQSRPITTLYPIPKVDDEKNHVYVSVGHQQMMTDPIKPLGISLFQLTAFRPMYEAGGRLFVDVADALTSSTGRKALIGALGNSEPLIGDALTTIVERDDFIKLEANDEKGKSENNRKMPLSDAQLQVQNDKTICEKLIKSSELSIKELKENIKSKTGVDLFDFILEDIQELKRILFNPQSSAVIRAGMNASSWINEKMEEWLGEKNVADILSQSVSNNVTSEMGLALLDVADVVRPYPEIIEYLKTIKDDKFLEELPKFNGGKEVRDAINNYLDKYGMRCAGEIDITKTRWGEKASILIPMILSNIKNFELGASKENFEKGLEEARRKEESLLTRLESLSDGKEKAEQTKQMINTIRSFIGYREYPKYGMISRYFVYKQALMKEAEELVKKGVIHEKEDVYYLTFDEFKEVVQKGKVNYEVINKAKNDYKLYEKLTPPRVMLSNGEIVRGKYKRKNISENMMIGLPVSSGIIEGRARVILNIEEANLESGDILITTFTDPSWTPLFVSIKGLVTEVGGLMTHGVVIAREYGIPAVVGVENATKIIKDGQQIRINGTEGYIELL